MTKKLRTDDSEINTFYSNAFNFAWTSREELQKFFQGDIFFSFFFINEISKTQKSTANDIVKYF